MPARDEELRIGECLESLCRTGPVLSRVVVVDDASSDATAAAARAVSDRRIHVVDAPKLPGGALGKPAACAYGARAEASDWLWFVDADVRVEPDLLCRLLAVAEETDADLISAVGRLVSADWLTGWLLPEVGLAVARRTDPARIADPTSSASFAVGHCLLVRRSVYDAVGGHLAIADQVVDDIALARLVTSRGGVVRLATAFDGFTVRMYDDAAGMWTGLLKNTSAVRRNSVAVEMATAALSLAPVWLSWSQRPATRALARAAVGAQIGANLAARSVARQPLSPALLAPFADLLLTAHHMQAWVYRRRGRSVRWRNRAVSLG